MDACTCTFNIVSLVISAITMVCSIFMLIGVIPPIKRISLSLMLETTKYHLYMKYFYNEERRNPESEAFKDAVRDVYVKIKVLIPDLTQEGFMQEDWLMADWLKRTELNRAPTDDETRPLAEYISRIRENKL